MCWESRSLWSSRRVDIGQPCRQGILSVEVVVSGKASAHVHPVSDWLAGLAAFCTSKPTYTFLKLFVFNSLHLLSLYNFIPAGCGIISQ